MTAPSAFSSAREATYATIRAEAQAQLTESERGWLASPEAARMSERARWAFLRANRSTGFYVVAFAGGVRLALMLGGCVTTIGLGAGALRFGVTGGEPAWPVTALGGVFLLTTLWLGRGLARTLSTLRRPLPTDAELGFD